MIEQAALLDQSHEAIVVRDLDNRIRYWGRGAERLYGWTAEEAVGRPVQELTYQENLSQLAEATRIVIEKGAWDGELRQFTKDGREVIVEGHWTLARDAEGNPKTILAINSDITEKKKLEMQCDHGYDDARDGRSRDHSRPAKIESSGPHYRQQRSDRLDRRRRPRPTRRQNSSDQTLRRKDAAENSGAGA